MKRLLLMSSSRKGSLGYLEHAGEQLALFLKGNVKRALLVPYAAVTYGFDEYENKVKPVYEKQGVEVASIHRFADSRAALNDTDAIIVGGGNTFALLQRLYIHGLVEEIRHRVNNGMPYMGWSAGSNVACPTIRTTNDMPVVEPPSFEAFSLIPFQINPHFISGKPAGHNGESREDRLAEYLVMNPKESVVAIREGSALLVEGETATLLGDLDALIFRQKMETESIQPGERFALNRING